VDRVRFQIINNANSTVLYEKFIDVNYKFIDYDIFNVVAETANCSNHVVFISFNYTAPIYNSEPLDLKVTAKYRGGTPQGISTPVTWVEDLSTSGHQTMRYEISTSIITIDQIIFQFYDQHGVLVREISRAVNFIYRQYGVNSVTTVPAAKAQPGQSITYSIPYYHPASTGLRIVAHPFTNIANTMGSTALLNVAHATPGVFTGPSGTATGSFTRNEPGVIDGFRFYFIKPSSGDTLCTDGMFVPRIFVGDYNIQLPEMYNQDKRPGESIDVAFNYYIRPAQPKTLRISFEPVTNVPFTTTGTTVASADGSTTLGFTLTQPGQVNQVRFRMSDNVSGQIVFEKLVNVRYKFANASVRLAGDVPTTSDLLSASEQPAGSTLAPNPNTGKATLAYRLATASSVQIGVFDISGRKVTDVLSVDHQEAGEHSVEIRLTEQPAGIYIVELWKEGRKENIRMVLER
jgi:hypothetical protein